MLLLYLFFSSVNNHKGLVLQKLSRSTLTVLTVSVIFQYTITTNSFENDVLHADKPVLVDFWVQWCPYCRRIAPAFDKVGE